MGSLEGVFATRAVWAGPREVVHVVFDPEVISYANLLAKARQMKCTDAVYTFNDEQQETAQKAGVENIITWQEDLETKQVATAEQKYYLRKSVYGYLPLTELQAIRMNALLGGRKSRWEVKDFLSPRQKKLLVQVRRALAKNPQALQQFGFPEDQRDLIDYQRRIESHLELMVPGKPKDP